MTGSSGRGDSIPAKIEEGLEHSRVLVFCMSANEFGSDWAQDEPDFDDVLAHGRTIRQADRPAEDPAAMKVSWRVTS